jgi:hypothetical protein
LSESNPALPKLTSPQKLLFLPSFLPPLLPPFLPSFLLSFLPTSPPPSFSSFLLSFFPFFSFSFVEALGFELLASSEELLGRSSTLEPHPQTSRRTLFVHSIVTSFFQNLKVSFEPN